MHGPSKNKIYEEMIQLDRFMKNGKIPLDRNPKTFAYILE